MDLPITDFGGSDRLTMSVPEALFSRDFNEALAHQAMIVTLSNARIGTRAQKNRAEVKHTRKKMFRQKGTGRARAGHSSTPLRRGGGRAFPSSPIENFHRKLTRRMFRAAMAVIFSQLARENRLLIVRSLSVDSHKTRDAVKSLSSMGVVGKTLLVDSEVDDKLRWAVQNLPSVKLLTFSSLLPVDLIDADMVMMSERSLQRMIEVWS